jgi:hypothetical protein
MIIIKREKDSTPESDLIKCKISLHGTAHVKYEWVDPANRTLAPLLKGWR